MKKENKNFLLNIFYQLLVYAFPLITATHVSRVLGAENVGIYSYSYSIVYMFMLAAMLGISNHGNRTVAQVRDSKEELSKTFWSIYNFQLITVGLVCFIYLSFLLVYNGDNVLIFKLQFISLLSVLLDVNWFYFGLEKFKITITRNLIIKILSLCCIFVFVRKLDDLWIYTVIMGSATFLSNLYLVILLRKFIFFRKVSIRKVLSNIKPCLVLFIPVLAYGVYRVMDKIMIGNMVSELELGFYENAEKIINIPIMVITALGTVMLPHMTNLFIKNSTECKEKIYSSMKLALLFATIASGALILLGGDISVVLFGEEFIKSGKLILLLAIIVLPSAWANVIRTQYLIPTKKDKIYVASTIIGAIINFFCNIILIPIYGAYGACVGTIVAEFVVAIYQAICVRKELELIRYTKLLMYNLLKTVVIIGAVGIFTFFIESILIRLIVRIILIFVLTIIFHFEFIMYEFLGVTKRGHVKK